MDEFDHEILAIVQRDNRLSHAAIGEQVGLSPSSVRRRLAALRESGAIESDVSILRSMGGMVTVIVMVNFREESVERYRAFEARMMEEDAVVQCYRVAGPMDFVLIVQAPDLETYEAWGQRELMSDPAIGRYDSHIVWSRVKFTTALPSGIALPRSD